MPAIGLILLGLLAAPFLLLLLFFRLSQTGLERIGLSSELAIGILALMLMGSLINIPLSRRKLMAVEERHFFGLLRKQVMRAQGVSLNVGGGLIPILLAGYAAVLSPLVPLMWAIGIMAGISRVFSRVVPGKGIGVPLLLPPIAAALLALILAPDHAVFVAFASGTFGILIGADLLNLPRIQKEAHGMLSIGGAGVFDAIFLVGIVSVLIASL
ncbi:MAG: DUF1614 domain-containing protein [Candidatus Yanofskybacteria bacterium]|nr:DUF1614 domain-containing protein [Candidatus Yanofskybacteria bacterium]